MTQYSSLFEMLGAAAPDAIALRAPERPALSHAGLQQQVRDTVQALNALGIGRNERVAIVLANGPEMASYFIACACAVAAAPLNPAYRADEFEFYLRDLNARALIVEQGSVSPAIAVAEQLGVQVLDLVLAPGAPAGAFSLAARQPRASAPAAAGGLAQADDVSMVLHTSGTTSRPKIVPLSQRNLCASARNIRQSLQFSASDCGLNIMPLSISTA